MMLRCVCGARVDIGNDDVRRYVLCPVCLWCTPEQLEERRKLREENDARYRAEWAKPSAPAPAVRWRPHSEVLHQRAQALAIMGRS